MRPTPLTDIVLARSAFGDAPPELREMVERELEAVVEDARRAWPNVHVETASFVRYAAERVEASSDWIEAIRALRGRDLYIAFACASGNQAAIVAFERTYFVDVDDAL